MWYDRPKPPRIQCSQAEWEWHCYRMRGREPEGTNTRQLTPLAPPAAPKAPPAKLKSGATAGWRQGRP